MALYLTLFPLSTPATALAIRDVTADGTWDCKQQDETYMGAVVIVEKNYAFIRADAKLGGYGKLYRLVDDLDLPVFAIVDGYMKDTLGSAGFSMRGPRKNPFDYTRELYLNVVLPHAENDKLDWDCIKRKPSGI